MRIRSSSREIVFSYDEFAALPVAEVCRRYGWGDAWVDEIRDQQADARMKAEMDH